MHRLSFNRLKQIGLILLVLFPTLAIARTWPTYELLAGKFDDAPDHGPVLLQFWASWCHSCGGVTTDIAGLLHGKPNIKHLAISIDEDPQHARELSDRIVAAAGSGAAVLLDSRSGWQSGFGVVSVPTIILLNREGHEQIKLTGHPSSADLQRLAAALASTESVTSERQNRE